MMCHSCSIVAGWSRLGDWEAEVVVVVTGHYPSVYLSFWSLALSAMVEMLCVISWDDSAPDLSNY